MRKEVPTITSGSTALEAATEMSNQNRGFIVVLREGQPVGIITEHDFMDKIIVGKKTPSKTTVESIMSSPLIIVDPDLDLVEASKVMIQHNIRRLIIVRDGIIYGSITTRDIVRSLGDYLDTATRDIIRWSAPSYSR
jgi:CBS domain-containing protein